jgi:pimeloyl-ACP methyl ester carboxylesterase
MGYLDRYLFAPPQLYSYPNDLLHDSVAGNARSQLCHQVYDRSHVPCLQSDDDGDKCLVLFFHGNNESLSNLGWYLNLLSDVYDGTAIAMEYSGYWAEGGNTSSEVTFLMAERFTSACIRFESLGRQRPIILVGYSLGAAIALHVADLHRNDSFPHGIHVIAPFYSALSVVFGRTSWSLYLSSLYWLFDQLVAKTPVLRQNHRIQISHGSADDVIPVVHGRSLAQIAYAHSRRTSNYTEIPEATHATIRLFEECYTDSKVLFFGQH